jgi:hypothetical protein
MPAGTIHELIDSYCELNVSFTAAHHSVQVDSKGELRS